ncbi:MAG: hypothetical protein ABL955_08185, partial [Elusimicrobiota bacterium]
IEISTQVAGGFSLAIDSVTFRSLASGATAIHFLGGTFVSTITLAKFEDATIGANVSGAALDLASRVTMRAHYGARTGPVYENDPNSLVDWTDAPYPGCVATRNVGAGSPYASISAALAALPASLTGHSCVVIRDGATYAEQVTVQGFTNNGSSITILADPASGLTPVVSPPAASTAAFLIANSSVNVFGIDIAPTVSVAYGISASSAYAQISSVNVLDTAGFISTAGVTVSSWAMVSYTSVTLGGAGASGFLIATSTGVRVSYSSAQVTGVDASGVYLDVNASYATFSVFLASSAAGYAVYSLDALSRNIFTQSVLWNRSATRPTYNCPNARACSVLFSNDTLTNAGAGYVISSMNLSSLAIDQSTVTGNGGRTVNIWIPNAFAVSRSYLGNTTGTALYLGNIYLTSGIDVVQSTIANNSASNPAVDLNGYNDAIHSFRFSDCFISNPSGTAFLNEGSNPLVVLRSTITSNSSTKPAFQSKKNANYPSAIFTLDASYVIGASTAVSMTNSTGTISGSYLIATGADNSAIWAASPGFNLLRVTSSTLVAAPLGSEVAVDPGILNGLYLSTNTFSGGRHGVLVSIPNTGAQVWLTSNTINGARVGIEILDTPASARVFIASNTIHPVQSATLDASGISLAGLLGGATIQNNSVYYRTPGSMGALTSNAIDVTDTPGLVLDHNRINNPGMITGGSFAGIWLDNAVNAQMSNNDIHSTGTALTNAYLVQVTNGSTGARLYNNIVSSSFSVTGASATIAVDAGSIAGFSSDYNSAHSSNSFKSGLWGGVSLSMYDGSWGFVTGNDHNSGGYPTPGWRSVTAGSEDFHLLSRNGRFNPATQGFDVDATDAEGLDSGRPTDDYSFETPLNGGRINQGSYGNTDEASRSRSYGCVTQRMVSRDVGPYRTVDDAVSSIWPDLVGHTCVIFQDGATYPEQVTIQNFTNNGSSITIMADPFLGQRPAVSP